MRYAIAIAAALTITARAQVAELPITPPIPTGEEVVAVRLHFLRPPYQVSIPWISPDDGRWGRVIEASALQIYPLNQRGDYVSYRMLDMPIIITGQQLDAAGLELGIDWVSSTGADQLRVEMRAGLRAILGRFWQGDELLGRIQGMEADLLAAMGVQ